MSMITMNIINTRINIITATNHMTKQNSLATLINHPPYRRNGGFDSRIGTLVGALVSAFAKLAVADGHVEVYADEDCFIIDGPDVVDGSFVF